MIGILGVLLALSPQVVPGQELVHGFISSSASQTLSVEGSRYVEGQPVLIDLEKIRTQKFEIIKIDNLAIAVDIGLFGKAKLAGDIEVLKELESLLEKGGLVKFLMISENLRNYLFKNLPFDFRKTLEKFPDSIGKVVTRYELQVQKDEQDFLFRFDTSAIENLGPSEAHNMRAVLLEHQVDQYSHAENEPEHQIFAYYFNQSISPSQRSQLLSRVMSTWKEQCEPLEMEMKSRQLRLKKMVSGEDQDYELFPVVNGSGLDMLPESIRDMLNVRYSQFCRKGELTAEERSNPSKFWSQAKIMSFKSSVSLSVTFPIQDQAKTKGNVPGTILACRTAFVKIGD